MAVLARHRLGQIYPGTCYSSRPSAWTSSDLQSTAQLFVPADVAALVLRIITLRQDAGMAEKPSTVDDYMAALGRIVVSSATMEQVLREAFCVLVGSKFAAIVAGGQAVAWLIDQCEALNDAHGELPEATRQAIRDELRLCRDANSRRNDLVHGLKVPVEMGLETMRGRRYTYALVAKTWKLSEIRAVSRALAVAAFGLHAAVVSAFGPNVMEIGEALRQEDRIKQQDA